MVLIIFFEGYIVAVINNYWIELLVLPIVCGGTAGWLYAKILNECRKEAIKETLKTMIEVEIEMELNEEENNEQSKETME
jgi:hypothetical protein